MVSKYEQAQADLKKPAKEFLAHVIEQVNEKLDHIQRTGEFTMHPKLHVGVFDIEFPVQAWVAMPDSLIAKTAKALVPRAVMVFTYTTNTFRVHHGDPDEWPPLPE